MKNKHVSILFLIGIFALFSFESIAQKNPQLTEKFDLTFNQETIQKSEITVGINSLNFKSELQSRRFFDAISDNLIAYRLDYQRKIVSIKLQKANLQEPWKVSEWNKYFASNRKRYLSYYKSILNEK